MLKVSEQLEILNKDMSPDLISWRKEQWAQGGQVPYIESNQAINQANAIFGYDGWSYEIIDQVEICKTQIEKDDKIGWMVGIGAQVKVTIKTEAGEVIREDVGYGAGIDYSSMAMPKAYESAGKEAISDGLKRALRSFGNQFGNQLYDKSYIATLTGGKGGKSSGGNNSGGVKITKDGPATDNQKRFIKKLTDEGNKNLDDVLPKGKKLDDLTKQDASKIINDLQK